MELTVDERVEDDKSMAMSNEYSIRSSAMSDVFIVLFISLPHF